jgi:hypothetical protein
MSTTPQTLPPPAKGQSWLDHPLSVEWHYYRCELHSYQISITDDIGSLMRRDWNIYNKTKIYEGVNR